MDTSEKDKFEVEKRNESLSDYCPPSSMSSGWQFSGSDVTSSHLGLIHSDRQMPVGRVDFVSNSASMVDSFAPVSWDQLSGLKNLGVGDAQNTASTSNIVGIRDGGLNSLRNVIGGRMDMNWNSPNMMLGGAIFLPNAPGMMPHCLSNLSADPAFIERAAKFSCFSGGPFADTMKPLGIHESMDLYSRCGSMIQGSQEIFAVGGSKSTSCGQTQRNVANTAEPSKASPLSADHRNEGSTAQILRQREFIQGSHDERNQCSVGSDNESDEANSSGGDGNSGDASAKKHRSKKRKRVGQENELEQANDTQKSGEAASDNPEILQKADNTPTSTPNKITGEQSQKATQVLDSPKGYIHVRARRGQATNSHSLAERVRREKISERMKFLQDLVPGCSKVTGKAVMLDEIINYVQSLQRQVEFLSMKLATVNPRLDLNIESLLAKDILQSQGLPSSTLAFPPGMPTGFPHLHSSQPGLIQPVFPPMDGNSSLLQRTIHSQLPPITVGFKEPAQLPNVWNDELHNVVQMSYATTASQDNHVATEAGLPPSNHTKIEL